MIVSSVTWGTVPLVVTFTDDSGTGGTWDFGDGTTATGTTVEHLYTKVGTYVVNLVVTGETFSEQIQVVEPFEITYGQTTNFLPLQLVNDEQYSSIVLRGLNNQWPTVIYDDGNYPLRKLSVWPVPQAQNAVELWLWEPLLRYEDLDQELNLPPGYERYLRFKLAVELAAEFGKDVPPVVMATMKEAEANVKRMNQKLPVQNLSRSARALSKQARNWTIIDTYSGGDILPWRL